MKTNWFPKLERRTRAAEGRVDHRFYTESGEAVGRLEGHFIYTPTGDEVIGWLAQDGKWIYNELHSLPETRRVTSA